MSDDHRMPSHVPVPVADLPPPPVGEAEEFRNYPVLFDPLAFLAGVILWMSGVNLFAGLAFVPFAFALGNVWLAVPPVGTALLFAGLHALVAPGRMTNVFYLRSFRTDQSTHRLRVLLKGVLGPGFRLSGIRRPARRSSDVVKGLAAALTALRYAGSKYMELEAQDDWMARLVASYARARFVFIDLRDLTKHVRREVCFTFLALGPERTVFLCDSSRSDPAWRQILTEVLSLSPGDGDKLRLVPVDVPPEELAAAVRAIVRGLPAGEAGFSVPALQYVRAQVGDELLHREARRSSVPGILLGLASVIVGGSVLGFVPSPPAWLSVPLLLFTVATGVTWFIGIGRSIVAWRARRRWGGESGLREFAALCGGLCLPMLGFLLLATPALVALHDVRDRSLRLTMENDLRQIQMALEIRDLDRGEESVPDTGAATEPVSVDVAELVGDYLRMVPLDAWDRPYVIESPGRRSGGRYDVFSCGPDGIPGNEDDIGDWEPAG